MLYDFVTLDSSEYPDVPTYSPMEVARTLMVSQSTALRYCNEGKLDGYRTEEGNRRIFKSSLKSVLHASAVRKSKKGVAINLTAQQRQMMDGLSTQLRIKKPEVVELAFAVLAQTIAKQRIAQYLPHEDMNTVILKDMAELIETSDLLRRYTVKSFKG